MQREWPRKLEAHQRRKGAQAMADGNAHDTNDGGEAVSEPGPPIHIDLSRLRAKHAAHSMDYWGWYYQRVVPGKRLELPAKGTEEGSTLDEALSKRIGQRLRTARERFGSPKARGSADPRKRKALGRKQLAELSGVPEGTIQNMESGIGTKAVDVCRIAMATHTDVAYLMGAESGEEAELESKLVDEFRRLSPEARLKLLEFLEAINGPSTE